MAKPPRFGGDDVAWDLLQLWTARGTSQSWISEYDARVSLNSDWHGRISDADSIIRGDWPFVDETGRTLIEAPMVANIVQLALEDRAASASSITPSVRCPIRRSNGAASAEKRERIALSYLEANNFSSMMPFAHMDYLLAGVNFKGVFPDYATNRPCVRIFDPRTVYLPRRHRPDRPLPNLLVAYEETLEVLMTEYPDAAWPSFTEATDPNYLQQSVVCLEWFDDVEFLRYAIFPYNNSRVGLQLTPRIPNLLEELPISTSVRPTGDRQFRGVFDQTLYPLLAENRMTKLILDHAEDWLESPMVAFDIANPDAVGEIYMAKSERGFMRRQAPDGGNTQIYAVLEKLRGNARIGAVFPEARSAIVEQNIASGAFVGAIQASFNTAVAQDRSIEATSWANVLRHSYMTDELFFGGKKWMSGVRDGVPFDEEYDPAVDIKGDYSVRMEYPLAGSTQFEADIRLVQASATGNEIISKRRARVLSSFVENALDEENQITREYLMKAGLAYIASVASGNGGTTVPNFGPAAALIKELDKPNADLMQILKSFQHIQVAPVPQPGGQGGGSMDAVTQASSIARGGSGGIPAPTTNVPGVGAPTASLLGAPGIEELGITA